MLGKHLFLLALYGASLTVSLPNFPNSLIPQIDEGESSLLAKREEVIDKVEADTFKTFAKTFALSENDTVSDHGTACVEVMEDCVTDDNCCTEEIICKRRMCRPKHWTTISVID